MVHLYKVPGFYVAGFFGTFGSGKSLSLVEHAIDLSNYYQRPIVSNIRLNTNACRRYAKKFGLDYFARFGRTRHIPNIYDLLHCENSIIILDEAGIDLFSRGFADKSRKSLLDSLFRIRHYENYLIYASQGKEQIDLQLRERTQVYVFCKGIQVYRPSLRRSSLLFRQQFYLDPSRFEVFNETRATKFIYPIWASGFRFTLRVISLREKLLFSCFHSHDRRRLSRGLKYVQFDDFNSPTGSSSNPFARLPSGASSSQGCQSSR